MTMKIIQTVIFFFFFAWLAPGLKLSVSLLSQVVPQLSGNLTKLTHGRLHEADTCKLITGQ